MIGSIALAIVPFLLAVWLVRWLVLPAQDRSFLTFRKQLAGLIRKRLGGYKHHHNHDQMGSSSPRRLERERSVAVVGAGLAGLGTAAILADRGFKVTLIDRNEYIGGKIGAWNDTTADGKAVEIEHGFHAFFRHYYNLNNFLDRTQVRKNMKPIDDYMIIERTGRRWTFKEFETSPVLNLVALAKGGLYRFRDILLGPAMHEMDVFLTYDRKQTFADLDGTSYAEFAQKAQLPPTLRLVFNTFARAFFADEDRMSMAELVKSFHFYYLSHDHGLLYDYPVGDYQQSVLAPILDYLGERDVEIALGKGVDELAYDGERFTVNGANYDYTVLATTSRGAAEIARQSPSLSEHAPQLRRELSDLRSSQRYAVMRVWLDRPIRKDMPVFVATERDVLLDALSMVHRITTEAKSWAQRHGGSVLELHCYAVPDRLDSEASIREHMLVELRHFFDELEDATVVHHHLQVRDDFTAFHVGMSADRPATQTEIPGLLLAGDWVDLPFPAMLMEAAYSSGLLAANRILEREQLQQEAVYSVPPQGLLGARPRASKARRPKTDALPQTGTAKGPA